MLSLDSRKAIIGIGLGAALFTLAVFTFLKPAKAPSKAARQVKPEDVNTALEAYSNAVQDGAGQSVLNDMNTAFAAEMGLRVYLDSKTGELVATDLAGKELAHTQGLAQATAQAPAA
jgi:hypothetical protein